MNSSSETYKYEYVIILIVTYIPFLSFCIQLDGIPEAIIFYKTHYLNISTCIFNTISLTYLFHKKKEIKLSITDIIIIIFAIYIIINSLLRNFNYNELVTLTSVSLLTSITIKQLADEYKKLYFHIFILLIICSIYEALYGQLQHLKYLQSNHSIFSITGSFHNPGPFAIFLAAIFPACLTFYLHKKNRKND